MTAKTWGTASDLADYGYEIVRELGHNRAGGRVTYLARNLETSLRVALKQFQFAQMGASWSAYAAHETEIRVLQRLQHPSIPAYVDSFETPGGFCLVQEYKQATPLSPLYGWQPEEVKQIAIAILKILVYLQQQQPPIIHRDLKPENILIDRQDSLQVYLVDFGFARAGSGEVAISSAVKGTLGFMPPEQLRNRRLTAASDLYSLGVTLICLLTQTPSAAVGGLIDESYRIRVKRLLPQLSQSFIRWLEKVAAPNPCDRYPDAATALATLQPLPPLPLEDPGLVSFMPAKLANNLASSANREDRGEVGAIAPIEQNEETDRHLALLPTIISLVFATAVFISSILVQKIFQPSTEKLDPPSRDWQSELRSGVAD